MSTSFLKWYKLRKKNAKTLYDCLCAVISSRRNDVLKLPLIPMQETIKTVSIKWICYFLICFPFETETGGYFVTVSTAINFCMKLLQSHKKIFVLKRNYPFLIMFLGHSDLNNKQKWDDVIHIDLYVEFMLLLKV